MKTHQICTVMTLLSLLVGTTSCFYSNPKDINVFLKPDQAEIAAQKYVLRFTNRRFTWKIN